jgi:general secretion pathway protein D
MGSVMRVAAGLIVIAMTVQILATGPARAETEGGGDDDDGAERYSCGKPKGKFEVNLKDEVALRDLIAWAMGFSCKRFIYASSLAQRSAKLTMITPGTLDAREAWAVFEVGLESMGLAAVPKGSVLEIVESAQAKDAALAIRRTFPDGGGALVRVLVKPKHVSVEDLRGAIELVKSRNGVVTALPGLRALLVTDDGRHVATMKTLVNELDRELAGAGLYVIPVEHRPAAALIEVLTPILAVETQQGGKSAPAPKLVADTRVNSLFIVGSATDHARIAAIVEVLDSDQGDDAQMTAVRMRNAKAAEVLAALQPLVSGQGASGAGGGGAGGGGGAVTGPVKLSADEGTNSVLVLASPRDTIAVRAMLDGLDAPRRQVYIEAMVLEVSDNGSRELGASWHIGKAVDDDSTSDSGVAVGSMTSSGLSTLNLESTLASIGSGFLGGILGAPLENTILGETIPSVGLLFKAVTTSDEVEVLASPHIMTLDNKASTISVGANIPYLSKAATTGELVSSGQQIERQKVALTLKITPHVAPLEEGDAPGEERIRLDIELEHNQLGAEDFQGLGPTWKERKLETTIVLRDQDTYVLGGLIDERVGRTSSKIPLLGDIPVLGALFRSTKNTKEKTNLLVIITPTLVDDSAAGRAIFDRRMREREEFLQARSRLTTRVAAPRVDYGRKRGVIAEIDASVRAVESEKRALDAVRVPARTRGQIVTDPQPAPAPAP